eukprot:366054-Pleurochrysis_carterae.AAC.5
MHGEVGILHVESQPARAAPTCSALPSSSPGATVMSAMPPSASRDGASFCGTASHGEIPRFAR